LSDYEPSCPHCGGLVTRRLWILSLWTCARCDWRGFSPSWGGRIIYLDPRRTYECPECGNYVKPKLETTVYDVDDHKAFKEQSCPRCHRPLPHELKPLPESLSFKQGQAEGSLKPGRLQNFLNVAGSTAAKSTLAIVGLVAGNWLLGNLYKIAYPWFYVGFPPVLFGLSLLVWLRARNRIKLYAYLLLLSISWIVSLSIGNITGGFVQAVGGLLPFYSNPYVLAYWIDYFVILVLLVFVQTRISAMIAQSRVGLNTIR